MREIRIRSDASSHHSVAIDEIRNKLKPEDKRLYECIVNNFLEYAYIMFYTKLSLSKLATEVLKLYKTIGAVFTQTIKARKLKNSDHDAQDQSQGIVSLLYKAICRASVHISRYKNLS